jgi:hypothetical protein
MAVITQNSAHPGSLPVALTRSTLTASDTLTYINGSGQVLFLYNTTASPINVTITGDASTTINVPGYGGPISVSGGKVIAVPASGSVYVDLDDLYAFLLGNVTVTGGTGIVAHLYI